jgi:hypothetical protein
MGWRALAAIGLAIAAWWVAGATSLAQATSSHEEYVAQVNPICKGAAQRAAEKLDRLKSTGDPFFDSLLRARLYGKLLSKAIRHVATVQPPPGEEEAVKAWLDEGRRTVRLIKKLFGSVRKGDARRFRVLSKRIVRAQRVAGARAEALGLPACARGEAPT